MEEGLHRIAKHFQEAANNEKYHAMAEFKAYNKLINNVELDSTKKNLIYAADGERYEHEEMYPNFAAIGKVEVKHEAEYLELKRILEAEGFFDSENNEEWICEVCGHVHRGKRPPEKCPLYKADKEYFKKKCQDASRG